MIELSRICKSYSLPHGKRKDVLRDVSITFRPGVNMGILGLNGQASPRSSASSADRNVPTAER